MSPTRRLFPHPVTSVLLTIVWLLLNHSLSPGHVVLGVLLGVLIPLFTQRFFPEPVYLARFATLAKLVAVVLWDIVVASFAVARLSLEPTSKLEPRFVRVPVSLEDDFALTALASAISLTPGTVTAEIAPERDSLLIHALAVADEEALVNAIKERYEAPIKEIFRC